MGQALYAGVHTLGKRVAVTHRYLVEVLQRVGQHPAALVAEITPRLWKQHFAATPLRSDLYATALAKSA